MLMVLKTEFTSYSFKLGGFLFLTPHESLNVSRSNSSKRIMHLHIKNCKLDFHLFSLMCFLENHRCQQAYSQLLQVESLKELLHYIFILMNQIKILICLLFIKTQFGKVMDQRDDKQFLEELL